MEKEIRSYRAELRMDPEDGNVIEGYAAVYDSYSNPLWDFREIIAPGAFKNVATQDQEVLGLFNHDANLLLSRQANNSLELSADENGLKYRMRLSETSLGTDIRKMVADGLIQGSSFAFTVKRDEWEDMGDGTWTRTIHEVDTLYDVSPVTTPAYPATSVSARSYDAVQRILLDRQQAADIDRRKSDQLATNRINSLNALKIWALKN